jgi:hypothetical protein
MYYLPDEILDEVIIDVAVDGLMSDATAPSPLDFLIALEDGESESTV